MKTINRMKFTLSIAIAILLLVTTLPAVNSDEANASILANFNPGNIMSDAVMTNHNSMNEAQIQQFLLSRCDQPNCMSRRNFNGESAARIIHQAAQEWRINPQVLIVKLQKEQGLITNPNPQQWRLDSATGFGCPDSTPGVCAAHYLGFRNQIRNAARFFRAHLDQNPHWWKPHRPGWNNIFWHPSGIPLGSRCGTSRVYIENRATSALYSYTPYRPNQAALDAGGWRPGDSCSSYGNRNFFYDFTRWFGSTQQLVRWQPMYEPRIMTIIQDTLKINVNDMSLDSNWLITGRSIMFTSRTTLPDGRVCLRTRYDESNNLQKCVLLARLGEFTPTYTLINHDERYELMATTQLTCKVSLRNTSPLCDNAVLNNNRVIRFTATTNVLGVKYYITKYDWDNNFRMKGVRSDRLRPAWPFQEIPQTYFRTNKPTQKNIPGTDINKQNLAVGRIISFSSKITIDGRYYYRTTFDTNANKNLVINSDDLSDIFLPLSTPRSLRANRNTVSKNIFTGQICANVSQNSILPFETKTHIGNVTFYRTRTMTASRSHCAINSAHLSEL